MPSNIEDIAHTKDKKEKAMEPILIVEVAKRMQALKSEARPYGILDASESYIQVDLRTFVDLCTHYKVQPTKTEVIGTSIHITTVIESLTFVACY
jgi:hypothetical protein